MNREQLLDFAYQLGLFLWTIDHGLSQMELKLEVGQLIARRGEEFFRDMDFRFQFQGRVEYAYLFKMNWPDHEFVRGEDLHNIF